MNWLSLFLLAFLGAIAYFQVIQGLTSAAIMLVATIFSVALSFGTYEYVAESFLMGIKPEFAYPVALMLTFLVPLAIFRFALDALIPRSNQLLHILDRVVGAVFGFITAMLVTGMVAIFIQMVPWGGSFLGFQRFNPEEPGKQNELWLKPDRFAASVGATLSYGVFSGSSAFAEDHPDFVSELGLINGTALGVSNVIGEGTVRLVEAGSIPYLYEMHAEGSGRNRTEEAEPCSPESGNIFAKVILQVNGATADTDDKSRFLVSSVRIVGDRNGNPEMYSAVAVSDPDYPERYVRKWQKGKNEPTIVAGKTFNLVSGNQVDVAFEIPENFNPRFVAYKMGGRVAVSKSKFKTSDDKEEKKASRPIAPEEEKTEVVSNQQSTGGGRVSGVKFRSSHFGNKLPLTLTAYSTDDTEMDGRTLEQGHLIGLVEEQGSGGDSALDKLMVPDGKALLQLNVESLKAGSTLGKALNFARQTMENYIITDSHGNQHTPVGKYAVAKVGGKPYFELQYFPEYAMSGARAIKPFTKIRQSHLKGDYQLVYLYLLDSGTKVVQFTTGKRPVDLSKKNLVAP